MKTIFQISLTLAIFFSLTSCISQKRVDKICQSGACPSETVIIKDTSYIERIDTIYRISAWDSILFMSSLNPEKIIDTIIIEDEFWRGQFIISKNDFKAKISHLQDSITNIVKTINSTSNSSEIKTVEVIKEVDKPKRDKWYYRFMFGFFGTWLIILVILAVWIWVQYKKGQLNWLAFMKK